MTRQTTLARDITITGTGLHSGRPARLRLQPARAGHGIVFCRADLARAGRPADVAALWSNVPGEPLNTRLAGADGVSVGTIEHLMAALAGTGVHNVLVEIDGPEVPILDGSARGFVGAILSSGLRRLGAPLEAIEVLRPVEVRSGEAAARLDPAAGLVIDFTIDFPDAAIGRQQRTLAMGNGAFVRTLCDSRTFCRRSDVEAMQAAGLGLGGTLENAVVVDGADVLTPGGLRHADEAVRHKMLDALGDLATAGAPILGRYTGLRAGHAMTNALLRALFADAANWRRVTVDEVQAAELPGVGVTPADLPDVA
ncbi:UDP-3-O-acyl-N-acetylglucosamine deacetylase [Wenxinia marina]|uniref:UDP-3-O-acyl-N-acetylglucosamine deacetylase n=1 Tax=Wenxinia marina DSM 24838 TaxID=1123501 RepID=A0A0D0NJS9_9RHOB|nr:UDP-3-O-acyl-N-acetylglucosamine deacetylase [Wenxinia marina]KIQ68585.1 UDP-3-O-[3-hydroxymyristoyl] N-acetylglucosamine deacetylase [Wenxinia marina DSM 24838]GGL67077.1 UDP-3-O-acyl-N-acetylglucosamine deacetylase [Wenxinia marina]